MNTTTISHASISRALTLTELLKAYNLSFMVSLRLFLLFPLLRLKPNFQFLHIPAFMSNPVLYLFISGYAFGQEGKKYHPVAVQVETPTSNPYEIGDFLFAFDKEYCPNQRDWIDANNKSPKAAQINSTPQFLRAMKELSLALGLD